MVDVSVIICSHGSRPDYLRQVLEALHHQTLPSEKWELLLTGNASSGRLATVPDISWHPNARHIGESELSPGLARKCGMQQAAGDILVFVHDDNVLESDYLSEAIRIGGEWPRLGVWGSNSINANFEINPPVNLHPYLPYLSLQDAKAVYWTNVAMCREATPSSAGLCIRRNIASAYLQVWNQPSIAVSGEIDPLLMSGKDYEIAQIACGLGLGMGLFPELRLTRLISEETVSANYLISLYESCELSKFLLEYKWQGLLPPNPLTPAGFLAALKNVFVRQNIEHRMYFAFMRAAMRARRVIAADQLRIST